MQIPLVESRLALSYSSWFSDLGFAFFVRWLQVSALFDFGGMTMKKSLIVAICVIMLLFLVGCNNNDDTSLKCMNCGESIAEDAKFCPQCGETILDDSDNNNNNDGEQCSHNWQTATCTSPKTCSLCGETEGNALGHTTATGVCERCNVRQGWTKNEVQSSVKVYSIFVDEINSAGGVDMRIAWENTSSKTIKYIYFTVEAYNAVDDKVYCEIGDYNEFEGYATGPFEPGFSTLIYDSSEDEYYVDMYWENCYYNSDIRYFELTNIRITYMDNTEIEITKNYVNYAFAEVPQGLYYTWNDEYGGYEVNYRLKDQCIVTEIVVPDTYNNSNVVAVSIGAFREMSIIQSITLPDTIRYVGYSAFYNCSKLSSVTIDANSQLTEIDSNAFSRCTSLTAFTFPNNISTIGESAFSGCTNITNIVVPNSVSSIGRDAFGGCSKLEKITLPFIGETKDGSAHRRFGCIFDWYSDSYYEMYVNEEVPSSLKTVIITGGNSVGSHAFEDCTNITSITLPQSITSIGESAFYNCRNLTDINIPNAVRYIFENAFSGCSDLESIIIPDKVESIGDNAFANCSRLTDITIPDKVISIGNGAFYNCSNLNSVSIPNSVISIGDDAFGGCAMIVDLVIPNSVTSIGNGAFADCSNLKNLTIPFVGASINESEDNNFGYIFGCSYYGHEWDIPDSLKEITITGNSPIGNNAFYECVSIERIIISGEVVSIGGSAFSGCYSLKSIVMPDTLVSLGSSAFSGCSSLTNVIIPPKITIIETWLFENCTSLTEIIIPHGVTLIDSWAFGGCSNLTNIIIPNTITIIDDYAFDDASNIKSVYYSGNISEWEKIDIGNRYNGYLTNSVRYYYSENNPNEEGTYWHYVNGVPTPWVP